MIRVGGCCYSSILPLLPVAAGGLHQTFGQGDVGSGAGLHRPGSGLRVRQPAAAAAGNAGAVEEEQTHRW